MKSALVIGLGRFGTYLALKLEELGVEVMAIDDEEARVDDLAPRVTAVQIGDCTNEEVVKALGVGNFDTCFVCIGEDFQASLEITSLVKDSGARHVVAKASRDIHAKFLLRNGADEVIYPERDMAVRAAVRYGAHNAIDYIELTPDYSIFEIEMPESWVGKNVRELAVRTRYGVNVIAVKSEGKVITMTNVDYEFRAGEHLIIAGERKDGERLLGKQR